MNQQHIIAAPTEEIGALLVPYLEKAGLHPARGPAPADVSEDFRERADTMKQMAESTRYCFEDFEAIDAKAVRKHPRPVILKPL